MLRIAVLSYLLLVPSLATAQPVSWGMAQCSALMEVMEGHVSRQPHKSYLADAAEKMRAAAERQSGVEGRNSAELHRVRGDNREEWIAMGYSMAFKVEFRDWIDYCRSLAKAYDIAIHDSMLK